MEIDKAHTAVVCLSPYSGGMEIDALKLAKKLQNKVRTTLVVKKDTFLENLAHKQKENFQIESVQFRSSLSFSLAQQMRKLVQNQDIKNIIFFGASELKSLYFAFLGIDINLIVRHGTTKSSPKKDFFHKLIYNRVNYHVANSKHIQNNVKKIIPFGKNTQLKLIYPSLELSAPHRQPHKKLTLLHIGRIAPAKGQTDAIEACQILHENNIDFHFYIVGGFDDDTYRQEFMNFYEWCTYKEKIELTGFTQDTQSYIEQSDIFLFPSHGEGLSNAFLEALANNLIALCYDNTSFGELQNLGLHFETAEDKNIESLRSKLLYITSNIQTLQADANANFIIMQNIFSLKKEIKQYVELLV